MSPLACGLPSMRWPWPGPGGSLCHVRGGQPAAGPGVSVLLDSPASPSTERRFRRISTYRIIAAVVSIVLSNVVATGIGVSVRATGTTRAKLGLGSSTARLASVTERNRIAREMHDVVAHSLTVMVALSDGAAVVVKRDPDRAGTVLEELSRTGRTALADMRRVLGVLRQDGSPGERRAWSRCPTAAGSSAAGLDSAGRAAAALSHTGPPLPRIPPLPSPSTGSCRNP